MSYYIILESSAHESFHITLLPEFFFDKQAHCLNDFINDVKSVLEKVFSHGEISVTGGSEKVFTTSDGENISVLTIHDDFLTTMHLLLLDIAYSHGVVFANDSYVGEGYQAHVSMAVLNTALPAFDMVSLSKSCGEDFETTVLTRTE